jgi:hypothetical protein
VKDVYTACETQWDVRLKLDVNFSERSVWYECREPVPPSFTVLHYWQSLDFYLLLIWNVRLVENGQNFTFQPLDMFLFPTNWVKFFFWGGGGGKIQLWWMNGPSILTIYEQYFYFRECCMFRLILWIIRQFNMRKILTYNTVLITTIEISLF